MNHTLLRASLAIFVAAACPVAAQTPPGACILNDTTFTTADGGCKDLATGQIWSAEVPFGNYAFAETYCADLVEGGFDDWRMPTLDEMRALSQNGGSGHLNESVVGAGYYTRTKGQLGTVIVLSTGQEFPKTAVQRSHNPSFCVRGGQSSGGGNGKGKGKKGANSPGTESSLVEVRHHLAGGKWTIHVRAPRFRSLRYAVLVTGLPLTPEVPLGGLPLGSMPHPARILDDGVHRLDPLGRASVSPGVAALRREAEALGLFLSMVVLDDEAQGRVRAVVPLFRPLRP